MEAENCAQKEVFGERDNFIEGIFYAKDTREKLMKIILCAEALVFTSRMDFPAVVFLSQKVRP